uniref:RAB29, member RAS onco family n=2 Tax=Mandrillus leucophaeus TaxID=9568 RepID=A0A2K5YU47_MANLE
MGSRDHLFKVLVVGDAAVGKTSLVQRYSQDSFSKHYKSTVGVDFALKVLQWSDSEIVRLQLWDIAGKYLSHILIPRKFMILPFIFSLCQCDLSPWAVSRDQIDRFSKENGFTGWTETSVKENKNINEAMRVLIEKMMRNSREDIMSLSTQGDYINLQTKSSSWSCC